MAEAVLTIWSSSFVLSQLTALNETALNETALNETALNYKGARYPDDE